MSIDVYYAYSANLTAEKITSIDKEVFKNRQSINRFLKQSSSKWKKKVKNIKLYTVFIFSMTQPLLPLSSAVVMALPPIGLHQLSVIEESPTMTKQFKISPVIESKPDKITEEKMKDFNLLCYELQNGSLTLDRAVLKLRAGGFPEWFWFLLYIYVLSQLHQSSAFQTVPQPPQDSLGWMTGKYDDVRGVPRNSYKSSIFDRQMAGVTANMCPAQNMADENGYVMSYREAYSLVAETYPGYVQVDANFKITDW